VNPDIPLDAEYLKTAMICACVQWLPVKEDVVWRKSRLMAILFQDTATLDQILPNYNKAIQYLQDRKKS
jgi:hypothetical protein